MTPKVKILVTARKPNLLPYSVLVFDYLRVGFPKAEVVVTGNALPDFALQLVKDKCTLTGASFENGPETIHHKWIESLLDTQQEPFWLVDTDQCFWDSIEQWPIPDTHLWGRRVPEFRDESTGYVTRSRLHTSLLYMNPTAIKEKLTALYPKGELAKFAPFANMIHPIVTMHKGKGIFYDTTAHLYHALGGVSFTEPQLNCFDHFNSGTISDLVMPQLTNGVAMLKERNWIIENPIRLKGVWRTQDQWFEARQV